MEHLETLELLTSFEIVWFEAMYQREQRMKPIEPITEKVVRLSPETMRECNAVSHIANR